MCYQPWVHPPFGGIVWLIVYFSYPSLQVWIFFHYQQCTSNTVDLSTIIVSGNHLFQFQAVCNIRDGKAPLVFDTGASISITPYREDFIDFDVNVADIKLEGINSSTICKVRSTMKITGVMTDGGFWWDLQVLALYVTNANIRLLSVQQYCKMHKKGGSRMSMNKDMSLSLSFTLEKGL